MEPLATSSAAKNGDALIWRLRAEAILLYINSPNSVQRAENSLQKSARYKIQLNDLNATEVTDSLPQTFTCLAVWTLILVKRKNYRAAMAASIRAVDNAVKVAWKIELHEFHSLGFLANVRLFSDVFFTYISDKWG